jgi:hypothetical protein
MQCIALQQEPLSGDIFERYARKAEPGSGEDVHQQHCGFVPAFWLG